jgi:disulfide bond formation protein DsbB
MLMNARIAGALTALVSLAALGTAYFAQVVLLLTPCELCLWERWPYRIAAALGILAVLAGGRFFLFLAALVFLAGAGISFVHVGVEFHWWLSPLPECNSMLTPGGALPLIPARPCDAPAYLVPGLPVSMAAMDFVAALVLAVVLLVYVFAGLKVKKEESSFL